MTDQVGIVNLALTKIGAKAISSMDGDSDSARTASIVYEAVRDAELQANPWKFALRRASLAASSNTPAFGYDLQYIVPADFLRLYEINEYPVMFPVETPFFAIESHENDGKVIVTNETAPLEIRYIAKITSEAAYDPLFVMAFACALGVTLCDRLTEHQGKKEMIIAEYRERIGIARRIDAIQAPPTPFPESAWLYSRF
jgi:hypothetical protein